MGVSLLPSSYGGVSLELKHAFETKIRFRFQAMMLKSLGAWGRLLRLREGLLSVLGGSSGYWAWISCVA